MKMIYETGVLRELGEEKSYGNVRLFTLIELEREGGSRVRLENVAATIMVTPKFVIGETCAIAFYHGRVTHMNRDIPSFRNLLIGYATKDNYGVANKTAQGVATFHMIGMSIMGLLSLHLLASGGAWLALLVATVPLFGLFLLYFAQVKKTNRAIADTHVKFSELGYINRVSTVYN